MLCYHSCGIIHYVCDLDASGFTIFQVAVVISGSQFTDQLHVRTIFQGFFSHRSLVADDNIRISYTLCHFFYRNRIGIGCYFSQFIKTIYRHICTRTVSLQQYNLHFYCSLLFFCSIGTIILSHINIFVSCSSMIQAS